MKITYVVITHGIKKVHNRSVALLGSSHQLPYGRCSEFSTLRLISLARGVRFEEGAVAGGRSTRPLDLLQRRLTRREALLLNIFVQRPATVLTRKEPRSADLGGAIQVSRAPFPPAVVSVASAPPRVGLLGPRRRKIGQPLGLPLLNHSIEQSINAQYDDIACT